VGVIICLIMCVVSNWSCCGTVCSVCVCPSGTTERWQNIKVHQDVSVM